LLIVLGGGRSTPTAQAEGMVSLVGRVVDSQEDPVRGAEIHLLLDGETGQEEFMRNLTPGVILAQLALTGYVLFRYRKQFFVGAGSPHHLGSVICET